MLFELPSLFFSARKGMKMRQLPRLELNLIKSNHKITPSSSLSCAALPPYLNSSQGVWGHESQKIWSIPSFFTQLRLAKKTVMKSDSDKCSFRQGSNVFSNSLTHHAIQSTKYKIVMIRLFRQTTWTCFCEWAESACKYKCFWWVKHHPNCFIDKIFPDPYQISIISCRRLGRSRGSRDGLGRTWH